MLIIGWIPAFAGMTSHFLRIAKYICKMLWRFLSPHPGLLKSGEWGGREGALFTHSWRYGLLPYAPSGAYEANAF